MEWNVIVRTVSLFWKLGNPQPLPASSLSAWVTRAQDEEAAWSRGPDPRFLIIRCASLRFTTSKKWQVSLLEGALCRREESWKEYDKCIQIQSGWKSLSGSEKDSCSRLSTRSGVVCIIATHPLSANSAPPATRNYTRVEIVRLGNEFVQSFLAKTQIVVHSSTQPNQSIRSGVVCIIATHPTLSSGFKISAADMIQIKHCKN